MDNELLEYLGVEECLKLNAKLQTKKNKLRKALKEKGVLKKGKQNSFDNYSYFSEAQYKELFTELFSDSGLELTFNEVEYNTFNGTEKQANGRMPRLNFILTDIETGFYEVTTITGEAIDKGDKAGYKAYTGALKYYLANTFMVATGDDTEKDSPSRTNDTKSDKKASTKDTKDNKEVKKASAKQIELINKLVDDKEAMLAYYKIEKVEDLTLEQASKIISEKTKKEGK